MQWDQRSGIKTKSNSQGKLRVYLNENGPLFVMNALVIMKLNILANNWITQITPFTILNMIDVAI